MANRGGYLLLTAEDEALDARPPSAFAWAWLDLMAVSLLWGLLLGWLWSTCWTFFGDYTGVYLAQVAVVGAVFALWVARRSLVAFCSYLSGDVGGRVAAIAGVTIALFMLLLCVRPYDNREMNAPQLGPYWSWLYPLAVQRVLLLMPLWGAWAMIILTQFCRPCQRSGPAVAAFARGCGALTAAGLMALPLGLSFLYLHYLGWWRPAIPLAVAILGGLALCRLDGGLSRRALLASNFLTQLAFLLMYLVR